MWSAVLEPYMASLQAGRRLALRTAAKMAQKAEYIWMDGAEGHESKAGPLTLGTCIHCFCPRYAKSVTVHPEPLTCMYRD